MVEFLCSQGADVEVACDAGRTPLFAAACNGHKDVVRCLVLNSADVNTHRDTGITPLIRAIKDGDAAMACFLVREMKADVEMACQCATRCADTPLSLAITSRQTDLAEELVKFGAKHDPTYLVKVTTRTLIHTYTYTHTHTHTNQGSARRRCGGHAEVYGERAWL